MEWMRIALSALLLSSQIAVRVDAISNGSEYPSCDLCTCYESLMDDEDCAEYRTGSASGGYPTENSISPTGHQQFCTNREGQPELVHGVCSASPTTTSHGTATTARITTAMPDAVTTTEAAATPEPTTAVVATKQTTARVVTTTARDKPMTTIKATQTSKPAEPTTEIKIEPTEPPKETTAGEREEDKTTMPNGSTKDGQEGSGDGQDKEEKPSAEGSNAALLAGVIAGCVVGSIVVGVAAALIVIKVSARFQGAYNTGEQTSAGSASEVFL